MLPANPKPTRDRTVASPDPHPSLPRLKARNYHNAPVAGSNPYTVPTIPANQGPETVTIDNYPAVDPVLPAAVFVTKLECNLGGVLGAGYLYGLAKYGNGSSGQISVLFYLGGVGVDVPDRYNGSGGLSHFSIFTPQPQPLPDGGATVALLGLAILGLGAVARSFCRGS
jgi:hypothetical protein